jgi:hypothetical protein
MNIDTEMDLFELILFDVLLVLFFTCFLLTAIFFTDGNLFLINLSLVFGALTIPFANYFGGWWTYLRSHERRQIAAILKINSSLAGWIFFDFGLKWNTRLFRILSAIIAVFSVFDLVMYCLNH